MGRRVFWALVVAAACVCAGSEAARGAEEGKFRIPDTPSKSIKLDASVSDILLRDVTGDEYPDLLVALQYRRDRVMFMDAKTTEIHLFPSRRGKFKKPSWSVKEKGEDLTLTLGDLDGDGDEDLLAVSSINRRSAMAFRRVGKGKFEEKPFWEVSSQSACSGPQIGDFDGDGHADIFIPGGGRTHFFFPGTKEGPARKPAWSISVQGGGAHAVMADVDGDGHMDVIVTHWLVGQAYGVLRGSATGLGKTYRWQSLDRGEFYALDAGDVDGDGYPEIAVGSSPRRWGDGRIRLYGNEKGVPTDTAVWVSDDLDAHTGELILHDLDGDGDLDLFAVNGERSEIYENEGGNLSGSPAWSAPISGSVARIADLDGNGLPDLVMTGEEGIDIFYGSKKVRPKRPEPHRPMPRFAPLRAEDLADASAGGTDQAVRDLLDGTSREEREKALARLAESSVEAIIALKYLGVISSVSKPELTSPDEALRPGIREKVVALIEKLGARREAERKKARRGLLKCWIFALEQLEEASGEADPDVGLLCRSIRDEIRSKMPEGNGGDPVAIAVLGLGLARITPKLQERYGLESDEGALVVSVPLNVHRDLGIGNLREGDVIIGVGDSRDYGRKVDPVKDPRDFLRLFVEYGSRRDSKMISLQWRCGPKHPSMVGEIHKERLGSLTDVSWARVKEAHANPTPWIPEKD